MRNIIRAALVMVVSVTAIVFPTTARADDPVANPPVPLSDAEKMKVRDLVKLMWKMQRENAPNETLDDVLNPMGQGGTQTGYEPTPRRPPFASGPTRITEALRHYIEMMRTGRVLKDPCKWGASAGMAPGTNNDTVTLSGKFLAQWCDAMETPAKRVAAKFQTMASLANEIAHVYQIEDPALSAAAWDPVRCDGERDSDCMSIKFLEYLISLLTDDMGNAHTSLASIEAEGSAGACLVMCLMSLGVDTAAEIADALADARAKLAHYRDRKMNLFENQINQMLSWRQLYYGGKYKSPLRMKVDVTMFAAMRILKAMYGSGAMVQFVIPNDGKVPISHIVTVNKMSQVVIIVITRGADGSICVHVWTDTNSNGMPDTGPASTAFPGFPFAGDILPNTHDAVLIHAPTSNLNFNDTMLIHDRRNGSLSAFEMTDAGIPTGNLRVMLRSALIADPISGNPSAGGFHSLFDIDETSSPGLMRAIFLARGELDTSPAGAVVGIYNAATQTGVVQPPMTVARAFAPKNEPGVAHLPYLNNGLVVLGNPLTALRLDSIGHGAVQTVGVATVNNTGRGNMGNPPLNPGADLYLLNDLNTGEVVPYVHGRSTEIVDVIDQQFVGGPNPDVLALTAFPGRLNVFNGDPFPAYHFEVEIATEDPNPGMLNPSTWPTSPVTLTNIAGDVTLTPIAGSPLVAQTLIDLDGDNVNDDAAVVARVGESPQIMIFMAMDAASPGPLWFPAGSLNIEPAKVEYPNLNADNRRDLRIGNALGGPSICFINQGFMGYFPVPCPPECPADFNNSGTLSVQDIFDFLAAYFGNHPSADFNNSGAISVQDIFDYLAAYFAGCGN